MKSYPLTIGIIEDLREVESALVGEVSAPGGRIAAIARSTVEAGGKRLRPALVLICGRVGEYNLGRLLPASVAVELVHTASLIHDDMLDRAATRRGKPTVYATYGEGMACAVGDFLFATAFERISILGDKRAAGVLAGAAVDLCLGEFQQMKTAGLPDQAIELYLDKIGRKTASLFEACCSIGGLLAGAAGKDIDLLKVYGYDLGLAFQIYDDILDLKGGAELGKPIGTDLKDGTVTLPVLFAMEELDDATPLRAAIENRNPRDDEVTGAISLIEGTGAIARTKDIARGYVDLAIAAARSLSDRSVADQLSTIGEFVIDRYH